MRCVSHMPPLMITIIIIVVIIIIIVVMHRSPSIVLMPQSRWGFQVTYVHNLLGEDDTWRRSGYVFMCIRKSVNATNDLVVQDVLLTLHWGPKHRRVSLP